ncbi:hypothetical protein [Actinocrispum wychmicini]|uniref:Membrane-associated oxidoreductase n=1 Tax=Actinocrispum wychmicini TaxID=1213861 RepID=A0A4V2S8R8_9PSEU|nr:hypothetical protein [Actinocrispum wychmicini]TCO64700.1 hypothetical protein EV192_101482 [Actinocrispum wychmicini]
MERKVGEAFQRGEWIDAGGEPIRGEVLTGLLSDANGSAALRLSGARITGAMNLEGRVVRQVIDLRDCVFERTPDLRMANLVGLRMHVCRVPGMLARNLHVESDLILEPRFTCRGTLDLTDAKIGGSLRMSGAVLNGEGTDAMRAARLQVSGSMQAVVLRTTGKMRLVGSDIGGSFQLSGAHLSNPDGETLNGVGMVIGGNFLANAVGGRFTSNGRVTLVGAHVRGDAVFTGAQLSAPGDTSLDCDRIKVDGSLVLDKGFTALGPVYMADARIGGWLRLAGATVGDRNAVEHPDEQRAPIALLADGIELGGGLDARSGRIAGRPTQKPLVAYGQVRFPGAKVDGTVSLSGAQFHCAGHDALFADRLVVGETLYLEEVTATGCIRLQDTRIGASLDCTGATFTEPRKRADGTRKPSLDLQFATVGHNLLCSRQVVATGGVSTRLAEIRHTVHLSYASLGDGEPDSMAFDGYGLVAHRLMLKFPATAPPQGSVRLEKAHVRVLSDGPGLWSAVGGLDVADFVYESVEDGGTVKDRLRWLRNVQPDFAPGPYDHLVAVYRNAGEEQLAEKVLLEKQRRRHTELSLAGRLWGKLQEYTVGYGYRPWLAMVWLGVFWLAGTLWFTFNVMSKLDNDQNPVWNPPLLAMDLLLPIIDLGQDNMWRMVGASQWISDVLIAAGWILATTVAASATRLLKRD